MAANNCTTNINIELLCASILYQEYNESNDRTLLDIVQKIDVNELNHSDFTWILMTLNFMSVNNTQDRVKFILIESLKLKLLSDFVIANENFKYALLVDTADTEVVYFENEAGVIYKRYVPRYDENFALPLRGETNSLRIEGSGKDTATKFIAEVIIDDKGYVTEIIKEPTLVDDSGEIKDFTDIYTGLISDILQYEDEE